MPNLQDALDRIGNWLQQHYPEAFLSVQPGLTRKEIEKIEKYLPGHLSPEVCELYQWKNGIFYSVFFKENFHL